MTRNVPSSPPPARTAAGDDAPPPDPRWGVAPGGVLAWVAVQLGCLALGLLQVPLAAKYPPGTTLALEILTAGQVGGAALLAPLLFRTPATALVVIASAWPTLLVAGGLGAHPFPETSRCGVAVSAWLIALFLWTTSFRTLWCRHLVSAAAALLSLGGALLAYLAVEFGTRAEAENALPQILRALPVLIVWKVAEPSPVRGLDLLPLGLLLVVGAGLWSARKGWRRGYFQPVV